MKKTQSALQGKPRRLSLNRETIRFLDHPELLELARGGKISDPQNDPESTSQDSLVRC